MHPNQAPWIGAGSSADERLTQVVTSVSNVHVGIEHVNS